MGKMKRSFSAEFKAQVAMESFEFTKVLVSNSIRISMDGRGCAYDNIFIERFWRTLKYEWLYMNSYDSIRELKAGPRHYLELHTPKRIHQSPGYKTQDEGYWRNVSNEGENEAPRSCLLRRSESHRRSRELRLIQNLT